MKAQWYGDHRDVVKWAALLAEAKAAQASRIVQVAMLTECQPPTVRHDGETGPVDSAVWQHFRNPSAITRLGAEGVEVQILDSPFEHRAREGYFSAIKAQLAQLPGRKVVLLDPDTGMSERPATSAHIGSSEVAAVWDVLRAGDVIAVYQHSWRDSAWRHHAQERFKAAVGQQPRIHDSPDGARDVIIMAATK